MENNEIKKVLIEALALETAYITNDGSHFQVIVVGEIFSTMNRLKQHQAVYSQLMAYIADNRIHSLSIKTYTPEEWKQDRTLKGTAGNVP
ncbi:Acid stress protein IbaG [Serratia symbiotica]|nr:Acid stress protein IbaG [Serratia symbiotica]